MSEFGVLTSVVLCVCVCAQEKVFEEDEFDLEFTRLVDLTVASNVRMCAHLCLSYPAIVV